MDLLLGENQPEVCQSLGLECGTCVRKAATSVANVCYGIQPSGLQQIFFQLFPSPGCQPMLPAFEAAYLGVAALSAPLGARTAAAA